MDKKGKSLLDIDQSDLFKDAVLPGSKEYSDTQIAEKAETQSKTEIPDDYVEVKLCTLGKLSAPAVLHFRNYTLREASELSGLNEENQYEVFARILNGLVFEDFDCANLNKREVFQILFTIYGTWWSPILEVPFYKNEELKGKALTEKSNIDYARLKIADLEFEDLLGEFKTPFSVNGPTGKLKLRLPTIGDTIFAGNFVEIKFAEEEKKFSSIKRALLREEENTIDPMALKDYSEFLADKLKEGAVAERSCLLVSKDGEELSASDKIELGKDLPLTFWDFVATFIKNTEFGLQENITFTTDDGKEITRRFQFRFYDVFPPLGSEGNSGYSVSFD